MTRTKTNIDWKKKIWLNFKRFLSVSCFEILGFDYGKKSDNIAKSGVRLDLWDNACNILRESFLNESISVLLLDDIILQGVELKRKKWVRFGICLFFPIFSAGLNLLSARLSLKRFVETSMLQCIFFVQVKNSLHCFGLVFFSKEFTIETDTNLL